MTETPLALPTPESPAIRAEQLRNYQQLQRQVEQYISLCTYPAVTNYKAALLLHYAEHGSEGAYIGRVGNALQELGLVWQPVIQLPEINLTDLRFLVQHTAGEVIPLNFTTTAAQARKMRKRYRDKFGTYSNEDGTTYDSVGVLQLVTAVQVASDKEIKDKIIKLTQSTVPLRINQPLDRMNPVNHREINHYLSTLWREYVAAEAMRSPMTVKELNHLVRSYARQMGQVNLSYEAKLKLLTHEQDLNRNTTYELLFAEAAEALKQAGQIYDWFPSRPYSQLDRAKVDFVVVLSTQFLIPIQVTSKPSTYTIKKRGIQRYYSLTERDQLPITIMTMINETTNYTFTPETMAECMLCVFDTAQSINP